MVAVGFLSRKLVVDLGLVEVVEVEVVEVEVDTDDDEEEDEARSCGLMEADMNGNEDAIDPRAVFTLLTDCVDVSFGNDNNSVFAESFFANGSIISGSAVTFIESFNANPSISVSNSRIAFFSTKEELSIFFKALLANSCIPAIC